MKIVQNDITVILSQNKDMAHIVCTNINPSFYFTKHGIKMLIQQFEKILAEMED